MSAPFIIGKDGDDVARPEVSPRLQGDDMCSQFEVADAPVSHVQRDAGGEKLVVGVVVPAQAGAAAWAPYSATVLAAVTRDGRVTVWDLSVSRYAPLCVQVASRVVM